ncbi:hypothetical protein [Methanimicrococcus blatticola]|nr:hypothetical protein [Methanimicrococcus blatticola]
MFKIMQRRARKGGIFLLCASAPSYHTRSLAQTDRVHSFCP